MRICKLPPKRHKRNCLHLGSTGRWPVVAGGSPATLSDAFSTGPRYASRQAAEMNRPAACAPQKHAIGRLATASELASPARTEESRGLDGILNRTDPMNDDQAPLSYRGAR